MPNSDALRMSESEFTYSTVLAATANFPLHLLGWKSFQDLCVAIARSA